MKIKQTHTFEKTIKKLHRNHMTLVDDAIEDIANNPDIGEQKKGDLANGYVYKFRINKQLMLLAYLYDDLKNEIILLSLGSHENFYRDLKNSK